MTCVQFASDLCVKHVNYLIAWLTSKLFYTDNRQIVEWFIFENLNNLLTKHELDYHSGPNTKFNMFIAHSDKIFCQQKVIFSLGTWQTFKSHIPWLKSVIKRQNRFQCTNQFLKHNSSSQNTIHCLKYVKSVSKS